MTLYEALQDIGKGRFIDNGCDEELIAIAKGKYRFYFWLPGKTDNGFIEIVLTGKQGENARQIERQFYTVCQACSLYPNGIIKAEYRK